MKNVDIEEHYEMMNSAINGTVTVVLPAPGVGRHYVIFEADGYLKGGAATDIEMTFALNLNFDPKVGQSGFPAGGARTVSFRSAHGLRAKDINSPISVTITNANGAADATVCRLRLQYTVRTTNAPVEPMQTGAGAVTI